MKVRATKKTPVNETQRPFQYSSISEFIEKEGKIKEISPSKRLFTHDTAEENYNRDDQINDDQSMNSTERLEIGQLYQSPKVKMRKQFELGNGTGMIQQIRNF